MYIVATEIVFVTVVAAAETLIKIIAMTVTDTVAVRLVCQSYPDWRRCCIDFTGPKIWLAAAESL